MSLAADSALLNLVIRMVTPMRREFGYSLDVQQFMRDSDYARVVLDQALNAQDQRLREYAGFVNRHLRGARAGAAPMPPAGPAAPAPAAPASEPPPTPGEPTEAELRQRMLRKYTTGLR